MNFVYFHRTQGQGVEAVHIWEIVRALRAEGHTVRVISPSGEDADPATKGDNGGVQLRRRRRKELFRRVSRHTPEMIFEIAEIAYNVVALFQLWRVARSASADIIFERYTINGITGLLVSRLLHTKWVLKVNYIAVSPLVRKRSRLLMPFARMVDRWLFSRADILIVVSSTLRNQLVDIYEVPPEKVLMLTNAADPKRFKPDLMAPDGLFSGPREALFVFGFVGGFYPWHGVDLFVRGFAAIADRYPQIRMLLVGDGLVRKEIEGLIRDLGIERKVVLTGSIGHDLLPLYLNAIDVGVLPDSNDYGSPMKIFEYMSSGRPVIVPDYPPLRDAVRHGVQGLIFDRGNVDALAACMARLIDDPELKDRMAAEARRHVVDVHNWTANTHRFLELLA